jgi:hypothetical protein
MPQNGCQRLSARPDEIEGLKLAGANGSPRWSKLASLYTERWNNLRNQSEIRASV